MGSAADASMQRELVAEVPSGFVSDEGINGLRRSGTRVKWSCWREPGNINDEGLST